MKKFLFGFSIIILLYHVIVTIVGYKFLGGKNIYEIAFIKEAVRIGLIIFFFIKQHKERKKYFQIRKYPRILFLITIIFAIGISFLQDKSIYSMIVGLKYDFHFLFVFLSATFIGYARPKSKKKNNLTINKTHFLTILQYTLAFTVMIGFIRQGYKFIASDAFIHLLGYGPVGDFAFGAKPPIYYRTGPGGFPRRQGLFSGPNNYGYFLVAFLPIIFLRRKPKKYKELISLHPEKILRFLLLLMRLSAIALTISRTAFIGTALALLFIHKIQIKKLSKSFKIGVIITIIALITGVSIRKGGSTQEHINSKIIGISSVINEPLGKGLGTAGPAIFHEGTILPENFFLQLMVDIGTIGFLLRILTIFHILFIQKYIQKKYINENKNEEEQLIYLHRNRLYIGRSCLLIMGLFLHVFEDSMVNYLFFIPYGILSGYLSQNIHLPKDFKLFSFIKELKK